MCNRHEKTTGKCRCDISDIMQMTWMKEMAALDSSSMDRRTLDSEARMLSVTMIPLLLVLLCLIIILPRESAGSAV